MSSSFDKIQRIKDDIENAVKAISDLINAHLEELSVIESRLGAEIDRSKLISDLTELRGLRYRVRNEVMKIRHDLKQSLREVRNEIKSEIFLAGGPKETLEDIGSKLEELQNHLEDKLDEIDDKLDSFSIRVEAVEEKVKDRIKDWKREMRDIRRTYIGGFAVPEIRWPEIKIPDVGKLISESMSRSWTGVPSAIVSSVRLPQADLSLIDTLVNAGVFRSRNEGIAFFAHRGIEASEEWLNKVKEKLDEIRKLQEETKKEIEKVMGEPTTKTEGKEPEKL